MSYTFNWDCKLPIKNIEDIVSINIVPETKTYDEGDYVSLRGQICIDGEYTSSTKEQFFFNECIPLDITLPNNGGRNDIKIEVDTFDYTIEDGNQLSLDLNLCLAGYDLDNTPTLVEPEEEIEVQEQPPVMFTKEAVITPKSDIQEDMDLIDDDELDYLDFDDVTMPSDDDDIQLVEEMIIPEEVAVPKPYLTQEGRKETDEEMILSDDEDIQLVEEMITPEEVVVPKPYLTQEARKETLTDKVNQILNKEAVVQEKKETVIPTPVKEVITEPIQEEIEIITPQSTGWKEMIQENPTKVHQTMSIPVVKKESQTTTSTHLMSKPVNEVEDCLEEEEILTYPLKESSPTKEKSNIFDMLYGLEQEEKNEQPQIEEQNMVEEVPSEVQISAQPIVQQVQVEKPTLVQGTQVEPTVLQKNLEEDEELKLQSPVMVSTSNDDSIASQFSDGESIIKIIFVQEEETTINDICTKYNITQESIYDCANIAAPLCPGDRVMINYGQYRRN